jgi:hypothetical protein
MTPVQQATLFFSGCLIVSAAVAAWAYSTGQFVLGIVATVGVLLGVQLVVKGARLWRQGVYIDYKRPVWLRRRRKK